MLRRLHRIVGGLVVFSVAAVAALAAQTAPTCPAPQARAFDFLIGIWTGVVYDLSGRDSTKTGMTAQVSATKLFGGCAVEERWHFEKDGVTEVNALVRRAFDLPSATWSYDIVTDHVEHVTYDGQRDGTHWRFWRDTESDGKPVRVRLTWVPTPDGYSEQIARSWDGGKTWTETRHINFTRARPGS